MADLFDLVAKLTLDSSEYSSGLDSALGKAKSIGGTIAKVGTAAVGAAAAGIVAFGKSAVEAGMNFDSSMSQVAATMGTTVDEISELRDFAQKMGSTTAFSATQAADALNYMALAGYDAETSMQMLPNVLNLAAAGGIELASASDMVTDAQSALGLSLDETSELVDKMAKASSKSNTSVAQLGDAILTVGGTAKNLAGGTTELSTALGILADNGIKGAEGGTALRNIILSLSAPTDTAAKKMKSLGLSAYDANGNLRPLEDIFGDLNETLSTMTQGEQTEVLNTLFNKVDLKSANALLATSKTRWKDLSKEINNASGAAKNMADTQLDNLAGDITLFKSALEGAQIAISDSLSPTLRGFVQDASDGVSRLTEAFKQGGLTAAMEEAGNVLSGLLTRVVDTAPKVVEGALALVKNLGKGLIDNADQIFDAAGDIVDLFVGYLTDEKNIKGLTDGAVSLVTKFATFVGQNASKILPAAASVVTQFATELTGGENIQKLFESGGEIIDGVVDGVIGAVGTIVDQAPIILDNLAQGLIDNLPSFAGKIAGNIVKILKSVLFSDGIEGLLDWANIFGQLATGNIGGAALLLVNKFGFSGKEAGNAFVQSFNETLHGGNSGSTTHNGIGGGGGTFGELKTEATETAQVIAATFSNLNIDLSTEDAVANLDALKNSINGIIDLQKSLATADEQLAQVADGTADEARLEKQLTRAKETVDAYVANAGAAAAEMASAITSSQEQVNAFLTNTQTTADGLAAQLQGLSEQMTTVTTSFTETAAALQLAFEDAASSAVSAWDSVPTRIGAMWSQVQAVFANAGGYFSGLGNTVATSFMAGPNTLPGKMQAVWTGIRSAFNVSEAAQWGADMVSNFISGVDSKLGALRAKVQEMANIVKANIGFSEPSDGPLSDFHTFAPDMINLFMQGIKENERRLRNIVQKAFDFRSAIKEPDMIDISDIKKTVIIETKAEFPSQNPVMDAMSKLLTDIDSKSSDLTRKIFSVNKMGRDAAANVPQVDLRDMITATDVPMVDLRGTIIPPDVSTLTHDVSDAVRGITRTTDNIKSAFIDFAIPAAVKSQIDGFTDDIRSAFDVGSVFDKIRQQAKDAANNIRTAFDGITLSETVNVQDDRDQDYVSGFLIDIRGKERLLHQQIAESEKLRNMLSIPDVVTVTEQKTADDATRSHWLDITKKLDEVIDAFKNQRWEMDGEVVAEAVDRRLGESAALKVRV